MADRTYDLVLFGATGFTGRLVAEALKAKAPSTLRWAIAGRNREKLEAVARDLGLSTDIVLADSSDRASLESLAAQTRVVCTTVGPYLLYGEPLVAACAAAGTHYCDLTGEIPFVRNIIDLHHETAEASGAIIVPACGFDSIPSDLGVWLLQHHAHEAHGAYCSRIRCRVVKMRGSMSGGTIASGVEIARAAKSSRTARKALFHPYGLNPADDMEGPDEPSLRGPAQDPDFGWLAPFIMADFNGRIVRRSHALQGWPWGRDFRYDEASATGKGLKGRLRAAQVTAILGAGLLIVGNPTLERLSRPFRPSPGEGPDKATRDRGGFTMIFRGDLEVDGVARVVQAKVKASSDPGYGATTDMLSEAALCLALDAPSSEGGIRTPATALGEPLIDRLRAVGMTFEAKTL